MFKIIILIILLLSFSSSTKEYIKVDISEQHPKIEIKENEVIIEESVILEQEKSNTNKIEEKSNDSQLKEIKKTEKLDKENIIESQTEESKPKADNTIINENIDNKQESSVEQTCTPKKFVFGWIKDVFDSIDSCDATGNKYTPKYGYECYGYEDNCGDTYYMLKLYDENGRYDYREIEIP